MSTHRLIVTPVFFALLCVAAWLGRIDCAEAQTVSGAPIKIGAVVALTGPGAGVGIPERNGMLLAERVINKNGGIKGRPIKLIIEDDSSKPDIAKSKAERLIHEENIVALLGPSLTASTGAVGAVTNGIALVHIVFTGLGPQIEATYKHMFHVLPPHTLNARALLEYATKVHGAKRIGVLHDSGYGSVVMGALKAVAADYRVEFASVEKFEVGANDVTAQAAKVKAARPDVVLIIATSPIPFRNVKQLAIKAPILAAIGSAAYEYVKGMGEYGDDITFAEFLVSEDPLPHQKEFTELFRKTYNAYPKAFDAAGWDAVHILAKGLAAAGPDAKAEALAAAIRGPHQGVLAKYDFGAADMTGIALSSYTYSKLVKGKFTRLPFVNP
jgi:branched-chain amino acid transport system substrate-binding protein